MSWAVMVGGITKDISVTAYGPDAAVSHTQAVTFLWQELAYASYNKTNLRKQGGIGNSDPSLLLFDYPFGASSFAVRRI